MFQLIEEQNEFEKFQKAEQYFTNLNESLQLKSGRFFLQSLDGSSEEIEVEGKLELQWFPTPEVVFIGESLKGCKVQYSFFLEDFKVSGAEFMPLACKFRTFTKRSETFSVTASVAQHILTSEEKNLTSVTFFLPNLQFFGTKIKTVNGTNIQWTPIELFGWKLMLYVNAGAVSGLKDVKEGYRLTHFGILSKTNGEKFSENDALEFLESLKLTLSLMHGRWVSPVIMKGFSGSKLILENFSPARNSKILKSRSVFWPYEVDAIESILKTVLNSRNSDIWRDEIVRLIDWYVEGNDWQQKPETTLILIQAALELASWNELVNSRKEISSRGFDTLPASDKIRLLLSRLKLPLKIPARLSGIALIGRNLDFKDGPHLLTEIRNSIIHPKRKDGLKNLGREIKDEYRNLTLFYLELSIFYILGYEGAILPRIRYFNSSIINGMIVVPWIEPWKSESGQVTGEQ